MRVESGFQNAPNWLQFGTIKWCHNFLIWRHRQFFWPCFIFLVKFSYWSKFHENIITGSRVMTVSWYKGLIRNQEFRNTPLGVLPNIWRLGHVRNTKFGTHLSNEMLLNAAKFQGTSFTLSELLREN